MLRPQLSDALVVKPPYTDLEARHCGHYSILSRDFIRRSSVVSPPCMDLTFLQTNWVLDRGWYRYGCRFYCNHLERPGHQIVNSHIPTPVLVEHERVNAMRPAVDMALVTARAYMDRYMYLPILLTMFHEIDK